MTAFLLYIARAGLYLSLFYAFYLLVMRRTTFFKLNRAVLLAGSYLCLLLPLIRLRTVTVSVSAEPLTMVAAGEETGAVQAAFPWMAVLLAVY
ncbi:MAG: TonB-dependent receptor, partial [Bacteroidales bacterium]|nr:TonB-dependent receptor [Bacteroidales bacterium]